jgi:hypothetical protein
VQRVYELPEKMYWRMCFVYLRIRPVKWLVPLVHCEDVFGPEPPQPMDVGAIGDGREKISLAWGFEDTVSL